jgi:hypothetical protein
MLLTILSSQPACLTICAFSITKHLSKMLGVFTIYNNHYNAGYTTSLSKEYVTNATYIDCDTTSIVKTQYMPLFHSMLICAFLSYMQPRDHVM